jgi:hypothetical protein
VSSADSLHSRDLHGDSRGVVRVRCTSSPNDAGLGRWLDLGIYTIVPLQSGNGEE